MIRNNTEIKGIPFMGNMVKLAAYVDDILITTEDPGTSIAALMSTIDEYAQASGYKLNRDKSECKPLNVHTTRAVDWSTRENRLCPGSTHGAHEGAAGAKDRGHGGPGRGGCAKGRGHWAPGRGGCAKGRGHGAPGRGGCAKGRGHWAPGRGGCAKGRGHGAPGRGGCAKGTRTDTRGRTGSDQVRRAQPPEGVSCAKGRGQGTHERAANAKGRGYGAPGRGGCAQGRRADPPGAASGAQFRGAGAGTATGELRAGAEEPPSPQPGPVQKQVEAALDFSRRYWHHLSRQLWPEECTDEADAVKPGWTLPLVGRVYLEMLASWYCGVWGCDPRDCKVPLNLTGLELDLNRRLHGQHLARQVILKVVPPFLRDRQPDKALTLSFHGWSGTGKNFVARMMAEHFYRDGMNSDCVKVFIAQLHFPHARYVELYKVQLEKHLKETNWRCKRSLFIFDEAEKLHPDLVDTIRPYVSRYKEAGDEDYRQSIFLFLSNIGGNAINEVVRNFWRAGRRREEITEGDLERPLKAEMLSSKGEEFAQSRLQASGLIDALVPFLPLEYQHVKLCARDAFVARGLPYTEAALDQVAQMMVFVPKEEKLFSASGCKSVSQRISYL
ncbi:torsin-3A-like [Lissotriton helveticus]